MSDTAKALAVALIAAALMAIWLLWIGTPGFPLDDPYIIQHSIHGLLLGHEDRFIGGRPLDGVTSPAFLLPILVLSAIMPLVWAHALVNAAAAVLYVVGVFRFATMAGVAMVWVACITILGTIAGLTLFHLLNGLETGLAMAAVIWALLWFRDPLPDKPWKSAILGVMPFIRPELTVLSLLIIARACWGAAKAKPPSAWIAYNIAWAAGGALPAMIFLLLNDAPPIPNTISAKAYFFAEGCRPFMERLISAAGYSAGFFAVLDIAAAGFVGVALSTWRWPAAAFVVILFVAHAITLPSAPAHNFHRYLYVLLPFAVAGWVALISSSMKLLRRFSMALLFAAIVLAAIRLDAVWRVYNEQLDLYSRVEMADLSDWIIANLPPDEAIAIHDAGYISLRGTNPLVDVVGLKTPASIEAHKRYTYQSCSRDPRALDEILRQHDARYFVVLDHWDRVFHLTDSLRSIGWTLIRLDTERGDSEYKVYQVMPPDVRAGGENLTHPR